MRCEICSILIGKGLMEEKRHDLYGYTLCSWCYDRFKEYSFTKFEKRLRKWNVESNKERNKTWKI